MDDSNWRSEINKELENFNIIGFISFKALKSFYDIFYWVYFNDGIIDSAFDKNSRNAFKLRKIITIINLSAFISIEGPAYSAVLLYKKVSNLLNMRQFEIGKIKELETGTYNKLITEEEFLFKDLYNIYLTSPYDIDKSFFIFNFFLNKGNINNIKNMKSYSQIYNVRQIADLVKKDFKYKLYNKSLLIKDKEPNDDEEEVSKDIIIIQDMTTSMKKYRDKLLFIKALILEEAIKNNYNIIWHEANITINKTTLYNKDNIKILGIKNTFTGYFFNVSTILNKSNYINKDIIAITDGEDTLDNITFINNKLNVISFCKNDSLKSLALLNRGKFFKL